MSIPFLELTFPRPEKWYFSDGQNIIYQNGKKIKISKKYYQITSETNLAIDLYVKIIIQEKLLPTFRRLFQSEIDEYLTKNSNKFKTIFSENIQMWNNFYSVGLIKVCKS